MPIPLAIGAALVGAAGSIFGAGMNAQSQQQANATNMKIARYQNAWNLEQWNRENAYNLPEAQMARLKAAGLNPNLVYGSGGATTQAASSPRAAAANYQAVDYGLDAPAQSAVNTFMAYQNYLLNKSHVEAQNNVLDAQADAVRANTLYTAARRVGQELKNDITQSTSYYQKQSFVEQWRRLVQGNVLLGQQQTLNNQKYDLQQRRMDLQEEMMQLQWARLNLEKMRYTLSVNEYETQKQALETRTRIAQKEFNMSYQDWRAMRFGNIAGKYTSALNPVLNFAGAWMRSRK